MLRRSSGAPTARAFESSKWAAVTRLEIVANL